MWLIGIPALIDGIPWQGLTAAGGGWLLLGLAIYGLLSGRWFVSRREADIYLKRAEKAEAAIGQINDQNSELIATARLGAVSLASMREAHRQQAGDVQ